MMSVLCLYKKGGVSMTEDGLVDLNSFNLYSIDRFLTMKGTLPNGTANIRRKYSHYL